MGIFIQVLFMTHEHLRISYTLTLPVPITDERENFNFHSFRGTTKKCENKHLS